MIQRERHALRDLQRQEREQPASLLVVRREASAGKALIYRHETADADLRAYFAPNKRTCFLCGRDLLSPFVYAVGTEVSGENPVIIAFHDRCSRLLSLELTENANDL